MLASIASGMSLVVAGCNGIGQDSQTDGNTTAESTSTPEGETTPTAEEATPTPEPIDADLSFTHPEAVQMDEPFDITVEGLPEETTVEVLMEGKDSRGEIFESLATVETRDGTVSLANPEVAVETAEPVTGTDPGVVDVPLPVAMIQFSTLGYRDWEFPNQRDLTYKIRTNGQTLGSTTITRRYPDRSAGIELDHPELAGYLYEPTDQESGPGVLVLHGSEGRPSQLDASVLASRGYTALALHYFGGEGLPENPIELPLEYFQTAANWLLNYETTSSDQVGVFGGSYGGMTALLVGSTFDIVGPVVSRAGGGVIFEGINVNDPSSVESETAMYTLNGEPLSYVPIDEVSGSQDYTNAINSTDESRVEKATIPVEEIDGRVLLLSGADDSIWNSKYLHRIVADRLKAHNHPDFEHRVYKEVGHQIRTPYLPMLDTTRFGGTYTGAANASHDHWQAVLETLATIA